MGIYTCIHIINPMQTHDKCNINAQGRQTFVNVLYNFSSCQRQEGHTVLLNSESKDWMMAFETLTNKQLKVLSVSFKCRRSTHLKERLQLLGRSCPITQTLISDNHSVNSLFSVSCLAAKQAYELLKKKCKDIKAEDCKCHHGDLTHVLRHTATGWENPDQWYLQTQTIAGLSAQGFVFKHCWKCSCSQRLPTAASNWMKSVPGERVSGPFLHLVIIQ